MNAKEATQEFLNGKAIRVKNSTIFYKLHLVDGIEWVMKGEIEKGKWNRAKVPEFRSLFYFDLRDEYEVFKI